MRRWRVPAVGRAGGGTPAPADLADRVAAATSAAGSAQFVTEARLVARGGQVVVAGRGEGAVEFGGPRGVRRDAVNDALMTPGAAERLTPTAVVWVDGSQGREQPIDDGKPGPTTSVAGGLGALLGLQTRIDAGSGDVLLAELRNRSYVVVGTEPVRGVPTTHFRAVAEPGRAQSTLELWTDGDDRLMRLVRSEPDGAGGEVASSLELYAYGAPATIPPPPA